MGKKQLKRFAMPAVGLIVILLSFIWFGRGFFESDDVEFDSYKKAVEGEKKARALVAIDRTDTVAGIDADKNGIRDDIERYIDALQLPPNQTSALRFLAYTYQEEILVDINDKSQMELMGRHSMDAVHCFNSQIKGDDINRLYFNKIMEYSLNTRQRAEAYQKFDRSMSGSVIRLNTGDTCEEH